MIAPIVLFVYNRPDHTRKTLEALQNNPLAAQSNLIIYSDGPRSSRDQKKVEAVRKILQDTSGFKSIDLNLFVENRGLARSIIEGVTHVINEHGRAIVLEDDLIVSKVFLNYMNDALDYYANIERVMHISGYWYPHKPRVTSETFLIRYPSSWGWATWERAWRWFEKDPQALLETFSKTDISRFNLDGSVDIWEQVVHNLKGKADTWAVFWYATIFRKQGLCLYPAHTLVQNIGMDGSGEHCLTTKAYNGYLSCREIKDLTNVIEENKEALGCFKTFHTTYHVDRLTRFFKVYLSLARKLLLR